MRVTGPNEFGRNWRMAKDNWSALSNRPLLDRVLNATLCPPFGGFGGFINHGPRTHPRLCLTFDDGPNRPCTTALLDILDALKVRATFFCVGWNAEQHPDIIARAANAGHAIGNHSMRHRRAAGLMPYGGAHIDEAENVIAAAIGRVPRLYRPPWGWLSPFELGRLRTRGYTVVGWDVYTRDWQLPECDGETMAQGVLRDILPGSIILFHDGLPLAATWTKTQTIKAVSTLVPLARERGFEFVTVPELLGISGYA